MCRFKRFKVMKPPLNGCINLIKRQKQRQVFLSILSGTFRPFFKIFIWLQIYVLASEDQKKTLQLPFDVNTMVC